MIIRAREVDRGKEIIGIIGITEIGIGIDMMINKEVIETMMIEIEEEIQEIDIIIMKEEDLGIEMRERETDR